MHLSIVKSVNFGPEPVFTFDVLALLVDGRKGRLTAVTAGRLEGTFAGAAVLLALGRGGCWGRLLREFRRRRRQGHFLRLARGHRSEFVHIHIRRLRNI